jgi:hypothetical protein
MRQDGGQERASCRMTVQRPVSASDSFRLSQEPLPPLPPIPVGVFNEDGDHDHGSLVAHITTNDP